MSQGNEKKPMEMRAQKVCDDLRIQGIQRKFPAINRNYKVNLASNDYLGVVRRGLLNRSLASHSRSLGTGGGSARLVFGTTSAHGKLEEELAAHFGYEEALVFTSGFMANYGLCAAIKELADMVFIDKRVHASVVDGLMQSMGGGNPRISSYKHNDPDHFRRLHVASAPMVTATITESLFSMTGKICSKELVRDAARGSFLIMDEAHSAGAVAPDGGLIFGRRAGADITVGTFGKALGSLGGFILCSRVMRAFLINRCRSFIFTTAIPPVYAAVGLDALRLVAGMDEERHHLRELASHLARGLKEHGFKISGDAHILAIFCRGAEEAVQLSLELGRRGIALYAVRPPTVPPNEVMLRISINASLKKEDLDYFVDQLLNIRKTEPHLFK